MPFRPQHSLLRVEVPGLRTIDTTSVENLYGMWSLFSKTSHAMEDGKRLENLSWRLWNRETFCCAQPASLPMQEGGARDGPMPALSSSLESACSDDFAADNDDSDDDDDNTSAAITHILPSSSRLPKARPELRRLHSGCSARSLGRTPKHITPIHLEKIVLSIRDTDLREPIELPTSSSLPALEPPSTTASQVISKLDLTPEPAAYATRQRVPNTSSSRATLLESSSSTVDTNGSQASDRSQTVGSEDSSSTEMSTHSIVRGFVPGGAPSSYRSQTNLNTQPTPILKHSQAAQQAQAKRKPAMFTIGTASDDDQDSSLESRFKSTLSESLKRPAGMLHNSKKQTSFQDVIAKAKAVQNSPVFESDDEDDEISESAIEDDDDSSDWEDSDDGSGPSSENEKELFQRVDSRPNIASRRSMITTMIHEPDRAKALISNASRSTPAMRRSRTSSPNGPSVATSPEPSTPIPRPGPDVTRARPIIMTTSNTHDVHPPSSPRTTRRNMLYHEMTESLRKNLLWERQHKSTGNLAALKRRHTSHDVKNLKQHPEPMPIMSQERSKFSNQYFDAGLGQYHEKGW